MKKLEEMGVILVEIDFNMIEVYVLIYYLIVFVEVLLNLFCYDGVCYGYCVENFVDLMDLYKRLCFEGFGVEV